MFTVIRAAARRMPMARPVAFLDETLAAQIALAWLVLCEVRRRAQMAAHAHHQRAIHEANGDRTSFHAGPWISSRKSPAVELGLSPGFNGTRGR